MIKLLSHLAHVEIAAPDVAASTRFYVEQVGLRVFAEQDGKVYLRAWGDYYDYSLVISEGPQPALVTMAWRTSSPEALDEACRRLAVLQALEEHAALSPAQARPPRFPGVVTLFEQ